MVPGGSTNELEVLTERTLFPTLQNEFSIWVNTTKKGGLCWICSICLFRSISTLLHGSWPLQPASPQAPLPSSCCLTSSTEAGCGVGRKGSGYVFPHPAPSCADCNLLVAAFLSLRPTLLSVILSSVWLQLLMGMKCYNSPPQVLGQICIIWALEQMGLATPTLYGCFKDLREV